jgi:hypothetical protein
LLFLQKLLLKKEQEQMLSNLKFTFSASTPLHHKVDGKAPHYCLLCGSGAVQKKLEKKQLFAKIDLLQTSHT